MQIRKQGSEGLPPQCLHHSSMSCHKFCFAHDQVTLATYISIVAHLVQPNVLVHYLGTKRTRSAIDTYHTVHNSYIYIPCSSLVPLPSRFVLCNQQHCFYYSYLNLTILRMGHVLYATLMKASNNTA